MTAMSTTDYLINAVFLLIVFRQARERELDRRSVIIPLAIVAYVAHLYVRSIPTAGNDLVLITALGTVGLTLGVASGFATHVGAGENGLAARLGGAARGGARQRQQPPSPWTARQGPSGDAGTVQCRAADGGDRGDGRRWRGDRCVFAVTLVVAVRDGFPERRLQLKGATELAAGVAVFMAITRLPFNAGVAIGGAVTVALGTVTAAAGSSSSAVAAGTLVTVLVGVIAQFLKDKAYTDRTRAVRTPPQGRPTDQLGPPRQRPQAFSRTLPGHARSERSTTTTG